VVGAELWGGCYRVVQSPAANSARTPVEVHYDCRLVVAPLGQRGRAEAAAAHSAAAAAQPAPARRPDAYSGPRRPLPGPERMDEGGDSDRFER
jgi:hypothetical protein